MQPLIKPSVHLNGTNREDLIEQFANVARVAGDLLRTMREASPNGRDYYPQGDQALSQAQAAFAERLRVITEIQQEFSDLAVEIDETE